MTSKVLTTQMTLFDTSPQHWIPRSDQKKAVAALLKVCNKGLFADPGAGKTSITLKVYQILRKEKLVRKMLVIAPKRVCYEVWPHEVEDWIDFHDIKVTVLHGPKKEAALDEVADIFVINPDGLPWLLNHPRILSKLGVDMLVVDESSKFKRTNTQRFKLLKPHLTKFKRRVILTGSPNPNGYLDLFGQIFILDMGRALGQYVTHYRMNYFSPTGYGGYTWVLKEGGDKMIQKAIAPLIHRIDTSEYVDLPSVVDNIIRVELPEPARKIYDSIEEKMIAELDSGARVTGVSAGAASMKCAQIANGGLYYTETDCDGKCDGATVGSCTCFFEGRTTKLPKKAVGEIHDAKTDALVDLVDELQGSPLLVAYEFQHDLERIRKALGKDIPYIGGGVSPKKTAEIVRDWNAGKIPVLVAHPAAMGHGLNLQKSNCRHVCWYGITWDYELYDQFIRRIRRPGNKCADVFCHHIVARDTVDEAKLHALKSKKRTQNGLLDALRDYAKSRHRTLGSRVPGAKVKNRK